MVARAAHLLVAFAVVIAGLTAPFSHLHAAGALHDHQDVAAHWHPVPTRAADHATSVDPLRHRHAPAVTTAMPAEPPSGDGGPELDAPESGRQLRPFESAIDARTGGFAPARHPPPGGRPAPRAPPA